MAKRILAVLLAAVLTLSLAACSGNTETSGTGSDSSAAASPVRKEQAKPTSESPSSSRLTS